jgi:hypothetical protein
MSLVSGGRKRNSASGIYVAAIVGVTDIDPFVLNRRGGRPGCRPARSPPRSCRASSTIFSKPLRRRVLGGRATIFSAAVLVLLAVARVIIAMTVGSG